MEFLLKAQSMEALPPESSIFRMETKIAFMVHALQVNT
jgi:hypothetical protein